MNRIKQINVRLTPDEYRYVHRQAKKRGLTLSLYLREALLENSILNDGDVAELPAAVKKALAVWHLEQHMHQETD